MLFHSYCRVASCRQLADQELDAGTILNQNIDSVSPSDGRKKQEIGIVKKVLAENLIN